MTDDASNRRISRLLLLVTWLEVAILLWAGLGLLLYPPIMAPFWPWPLTPFNMRYLGALYSAALIAALLQAASGHWSPARVVTPMIFLFTSVVTLYSFVHFSRFGTQPIESWPWKLDAFHAQLYSVTFLTPALGAWVLLRGTTRSDQQTFGLTLGAWGLLPILGLFLADATAKRVGWGLASTWLWLALFASMTLVGAWLVAGARTASLKADARN